MNNDKRYLIWLMLVSGPTLVQKIALWDRFGNLKNLFEADEFILRENGISDVALINGLLHPAAREKSLYRAEKMISSGIRVTGLNDPDYPQNLKKIYDPPLGLFYRGTIPDNYSYISIVGSRKATTYGRKTAYDLAAGLAGFGVCVISGMARGIDSCAHNGALAAKGKTIAVLGCGVDVVYPPENGNLMDRIIENGAVMSELLSDTPPLAQHFPVRNRIISGMSDATVVVEAARESGSLITADFASEQNRDVFAVPGNITSDSSTGTNALIKQGARLCAGVGDILCEIPALRDAASKAPDIIRPMPQWDRDPDLTPEDLAVIKCISKEAFHPDAICGFTGLSPKVVGASLLNLQLKGFAEEYPGKTFGVIRRSKRSKR